MLVKTKNTQTSKLWKYNGPAAWFFLGVDRKISTELREKYKSKTKNFGTIPVKVTIGKTTWQTSLFYDTKMEHYLLPIKADIRKKEELDDGDNVTFSFVVGA